MTLSSAAAALRWRRGRRAVTAGAVMVGVSVVAGAVLPNGLPAGVVLLGLVLGTLSSLTAVGIVLVYRAARVINFAQAEIGAVAASVAVLLVTGEGVPYLVAVPVGLAAAVVSGGLIELLFLRRLSKAPRLLLTVATIGVAQLLGALEIYLPTTVHHLRELSTFTTPFRARFAVGPIVFGGDHVAALLAAPTALTGLAWFLNRTGAGVAIRGAADSQDRALLLGIPVARLSLITWVLAAALSGLGSLLTTPILGANLGAVPGPTALLAPLAAAVLGGLRSIPRTVIAALGIGVLQQAVFWSYPEASRVDIALFAVIMVGLVTQRRRRDRGDELGYGDFLAAAAVRPIPTALRSLPVVQRLRSGTIAAGGVAAFLLPFVLTDANTTLCSYIAVYGIVAVSLVVLTGWSGQISLGQFAFVGIGAGVTASLLVHARLDLFAALAVATIGTGAAAVLVGLPALRVPGLLLSVVTLAFAVPVSTFLLSSTNVPILSPAIVPRPVLLGRFPLDTPRTFYYLCVAFLVLSIVLARNFRGSRIGRIVIAVRDNDRGAASFSIRPVRAKLTAFAVSGGLAGLAGGLYVVGLRGIAFSGFQPEASLQVFTMVVVGGLGSLFGALLGAAFVQSAQYFLHGAVSLLATGAGLLLVIELLPAGLASLVYRARDRLLRALVNRQDTAGRGPDASDHAGEAGVCDPRTDWDLGPNLDGQDVPGAIPVAVGVESTGR